MFQNYVIKNFGNPIPTIAALSVVYSNFGMNDFQPYFASASFSVVLIQS
jgi:hypothetical protein